MSKMKKIFAVIISLAMVLGMSMTTLAEEGIPEKTDRGTVKITNITGSPTVTLYKIAEAEYGDNDTYLIKYNWAEGTKFNDEKAPTASEITNIANGIVGGTIDPLEQTDQVKVTGDVYAKEVSAGAYIAIITGANDGSVYNPILLTASYNGEGNLVVENEGINATDTYLYGTTAVAKKTTPSIDKTVSGTTPDEDKETASVGDVLTYTITPTMPSYPKAAVNKTFFISDTMTDGLTFDFDSLTITIANETVTKNENRFYLNNEVIAEAAKIGNGFNLLFTYDNLIISEEIGNVYSPVVTYTATINETAVVGADGNTNSATLYYANEPNNGQTHTDVNVKPDTGTSVTSKENSKTVYTYQLAFKKIGEGNDANGLQGAVFGIYKDENCATLVDTVITNENGYAVSTNVAAGTYYIKEISAPTGYSLNDKVFEIEANWNTAITTVTGTVTHTTYTTEKPDENAVQVGWLKNGVFYTKNAFADETAAAAGAQAAYIDSSKMSSTSATTIEGNQAGSGTTLLGVNIPNTKLSSLPSTGGIGTTIFTIGGCLIMIIAAALFFASRKKTSK